MNLKIGDRFQFAGSPVFEVAINPAGVLLGHKFRCEVCPLNRQGEFDTNASFCLQFISSVACSTVCPIMGQKLLMLKVVLEEVENE